MQQDFKVDKTKPLLVCGASGMVGSACVRTMKKLGYENILTPTHTELDNLDAQAVSTYFNKEKPAYVILASARVGGIAANIKAPYEFLFENLQIQNNIINESYVNQVEKLVFLGSSCIYPKDSQQPMKEEYLLQGPLELTNEGYALAKIAGLRMVEFLSQEYGFNGISLMPPNLYGPNDDFDLEKSHVMSALVKKFTDARDTNADEVTVWGTGVARREFMHVDDLASAVGFFFENYSESEFINVGVGRDVSILELAELISESVGYKGKIVWDSSKPDGMLKKCLDVSKMKSHGFEPKISIEDGIRDMIARYETLKVETQ